MAYTHCKTRIINLKNFEIPDHANEDEYRGVFSRIRNANNPQSQSLVDAISSLAIGIAPPVAFPTETVYGLGADATNQASIAGIFAAKGRPSDNPLIVHVASKEHLERLIGDSIPAIYETLVQKYWPGPLTILVPLPEKSVFAKNVHPGQRTIGFRVPQSKYARFLIAAADRPIAAPSANSSGKPSPTTAEHVLHDLKGKINFILDGGSCDVGVESTVIDGLHDPPLILRPGGVSQDDLISHGREFGNAWSQTGIGYKQVHYNHTNSVDEEDEGPAPRAPGMKYKHYAPHGKLILFDGQSSLKLVKPVLDSILNRTSTVEDHQLTNPEITTNGSAHTSSQLRYTIVILTSTTWPSFADLPTTDYPIQNGELTSNHTSSSSPSTTSPSTSITTPSSSTPTKAIYKTHTLITIPLGKTPQQIAKSLFAALRTCDDLGCHYILAEAPLSPRSSGLSSDESDESMVKDHHYDAVIERMRKAASEVVSG